MRLRLKALILAFFLNYSFLAIGQETSGSFSTQITNSYSYGYLLYKPKDVSNKKPIIVFLHGSGEKGTDLEKVKIHGPFKYLKNNELDAFVLAPQCPDNMYWESESLYRLILKITNENNIDINRIYLTGLSMGGWGTWNLAIAHPEMFAAMVPIAGFVDRVPLIEDCKMAIIPTWIFHGLLDNVVDVNYSTVIYKRLKACKADVKLTIFDDANHDSWSRVYDNSEIYQWMFQHSKK